MTETQIKIINKNRKAYFDYSIDEKIECGICLTGTEIKSLRVKGCNVSDSFLMIKDGEAWLYKMEIPIYPFGNILNHDPFRKRKLLMHKKQIHRLEDDISRKNLSAIPIEVYLKNGLAKILIGIGKGKKLSDKRENIKKRLSEKDISRAVKRTNFK